MQILTMLELQEMNLQYVKRKYWNLLMYLHRIVESWAIIKTDIPTSMYFFYQNVKILMMDIALCAFILLLK